MRRSVLMGKLNVIASVLGFMVFYCMYAIHLMFNTAYDWAILLLVAMLIAALVSDDYLERLVKLDGWIRRVSA